jgi:hypothetical protein
LFQCSTVQKFKLPPSLILDSDGRPNGIWHFGCLVPSLDPINAITPVHQGESAPGRHAENYIVDPHGNRIDVVLDMWPT